MIKVAVIQNLANSMFPRVEALRKRGVDAHLYVGFKNRSPDGKPLPDPSQDPKFLTGQSYPWVHYLDFSNSLYPFFYNLTELSSYDIIHSCCLAPIVNQFFCRGKKFLIHTHGSDLRSFSISHGLKPMLLRRAYKKAKILIYEDLDHGTLGAIEKLNLGFKARHLEYIVDFPERDSGTERKLVIDTFRILYPNELRDRFKGISIFIEAIERVARSGRKFNVDMISSGEDYPAILKKLTSLKVGEYIQWHPFLNRHQLAKLYRSSDLVIGYFKHRESGVSHYPQVLFEGCFFGKAVLSSYDEKVVKKYYPDYPILLANSPDEVYERLVSLIDDRAQCHKLGTQALRWFEQNASEEKITEKLLNIYSEL